MKKYICLLSLCCLQMLMNVWANERMLSQDRKQSAVRTYFEDLYRLRNTYPLTLPKADKGEVQDAVSFLKSINLTETGEIKREVMLLLSASVRSLAYASLSGLPEGKGFSSFMDRLLENRVIERFPGLVYSNYGDVRTIPADFLSALPACNAQQRGKLIAAVKHLVEFDKLYRDAATVKMNVNTDYMYNVLPHLFICALHQPDEKLAVKDILAFSHYISACTQYSSGSKDGLKIDGTGFHHRTHYNGYMYAYKTWVHYMARLKGTAFRIDEDAYQRISKAVVSEFLMATLPTSGEGHYFANSLAGRHPFAGLMVDFSQELFRELVEVGGDVKGKEIDEELAAYYNAFFQTDYYKQVKPKELDGFYQFNYSPAGVYRHSNWVATMRCPTTRFWGGEIYNKTNRFGRYQSHGTLEVLYNGSLEQSGYPPAWERFSGKRGGWDWNVVPGSTTVHYTDWKEMMPNGNDADRFDQWAATTNFSGALSWGDCGMFACAFDQGDHWGGRRFVPTNLTFCKSVFAFDGVLLSLGSGVTSWGDYAGDRITATNLFQALEGDGNISPVLNGQPLPKGTSLSLDSDKDNWIVTPCNTGYLIPAGNDSLVIRYGEQVTPGPEGAGETSFGARCASKAFINHGLKPTKKKYCFAVVPATTPKAMSARAGRIFHKKGLFAIKQHQDSLHVVEHIPSGTLSYALFAPASTLCEGYLRSSDTALLLMERKLGKNLDLAVCCPDLRPVPDERKDWYSTPAVATLTFDGLWTLSDEMKNRDNILSCSYGESSTRLTVKLEEGLPVYIRLTPK